MRHSQLFDLIRLDLTPLFNREKFHFITRPTCSCIQLGAHQVSGACRRSHLPSPLQDSFYTNSGTSLLPHTMALSHGDLLPRLELDQPNRCHLNQSEYKPSPTRSHALPASPLRSTAFRLRRAGRQGQAKVSLAKQIRMATERPRRRRRPPTPQEPSSVSSILMLYFSPTTLRGHINFALPYTVLISIISALILKY